MNLTEDLRRLARMSQDGQAFTTVYLNTKWSDEQQRERVKIFVKRELKTARDNRPRMEEHLVRSLEQIESYIHGLIKQEYDEQYDGIAMFVNNAMDFSLTLRSRVPFENQFAIASEFKLRQLARLADEYSHALLLMIDTDSARIFDVALGGFAYEADIKSDVDRRHSQGGWSQMRYQRHRQEQQDRHSREVAEYLTHIFNTEKPDHLILSGQEQIAAAFREFLPSNVSARIIDIVKLDMKEDRDKIIQTAVDCLQNHERQEEADSVGKLLETANAGGPAVIGADAVAQKSLEGKASQLLIHRRFSMAGWRCRNCGSLGRKVPLMCPVCEGTVESSDLGEDVIRETIRRDGGVESVADDDRLAQSGGIGAFLRYK